jgi:hypothetical protein
VRWPALALGTLFSVVAACSGDEREDAGPGAGAPIPDPAACPAPYVDCDGNPSTICETRVDDDVANCGACGSACPAPGAHQVASCSAGACGALTCEGGYIDCDHDPTNGCEEPIATCGVTTLVTNLTAPWGLGVDDGFVYYGSRGTPPLYADGILYRVPKNGGTPVVLATGLNVPLNLTLDDARVYWSGGNGDKVDGALSSVAKTGGATTIVIAGPLMRPGNPVIAGDRIFFTVREQPLGRILSAHKDGSDASPTEVATGLANATDLEVAGTTLVWATDGKDPAGKDALVERANFDGTERVQLAKALAGPTYQLGVAPDAVFVGSFVDGTVRRVPFDLSGPTIFATGLVKPYEVIADGDTVYASTGPGHRVVALGAGAAASVVVAAGQTHPTYMAMDADYIYWLDGLLDAAATLRKAKKPGK